MTAGDEQDRALDGYMIRWNRFRTESGHVLAASELLALGGLLRELDEKIRWYDSGLIVWWDSAMWEAGSQKDGIRARLEKLLGMHPGSLDTSRRV